MLWWASENSEMIWSNLFYLTSEKLQPMRFFKCPFGYGGFFWPPHCWLVHTNSLFTILPFLSYFPYGIGHLTPGKISMKWLRQTLFKFATLSLKKNRYLYSQGHLSNILFSPHPHPPPPLWAKHWDTTEHKNRFYYLNGVSGTSTNTIQFLLWIYFSFPLTVVVLLMLVCISKPTIVFVIGAIYVNL